jgi:hypothetical protein
VVGGGGLEVVVRGWDGGGVAGAVKSRGMSRRSWRTWGEPGAKKAWRRSPGRGSGRRPQGTRARARALPHLEPRVEHLHALLELNVLRGALVQRLLRGEGVGKGVEDWALGQQGAVGAGGRAGRLRWGVGTAAAQRPSHLHRVGGVPEVLRGRAGRLEGVRF